MSEDYASFEGYVPTTVDPGIWMTVGTFIFCVLTVIVLAYMIWLTHMKRKAIEAKRSKMIEDGLVMTEEGEDKASVGTNSTEDSDADSILTEVENDDDSVTSTTLPIVDTLCNCGGEEPMSTSAPVVLRKKNPRRFRGGASLLSGWFEQREKSPEEKRGIRHGRTARVVIVDESLPVFNSAVDSNKAEKVKEQELISDFQQMPEAKVNKSDQDAEVQGMTVSVDYQQMEGTKEEGIPDQLTATSAFKQLRRALKSFGRKVRRVAKYDNEMKKILKLAIPYTVSAVFGCVSNLLSVAVIGRLLGTQELAAYYAVYFALALTTLWLRGILDSLTTICSQAIGLDEDKLAGEYVQIAVLLSQILYVPQIVFWMYFMDDLIIWLGFDEATAEIGHNFAIVVMLNEFFGFASTGLHNFLSVCGYEEFSAMISILHSLTGIIVVLSVALTFSTSLQTIGIIYFVLNVIFFVVMIVCIQWKGWFDRYWSGMIGTFAFSNIHAVKHLISTAIPLSFAHLLSDGEWEILLLFASFLGPAEVVAFGIFGSIWESVDSVTEALGDAAEVRCAHLLGADKPMRAKQSAQISMLLGFVESLSLVVFLALCEGFVPSWITNEPTLQNMLSELFPLLCIGVFFDYISSLSFALVGAQGCFGLATAIYFFGSWLVTLPLAFVFTKVVGFNLQGLVASVVVGNTFSGMINTFLLLDSDWYYFAALTKQQNKAKTTY